MNFDDKTIRHIEIESIEDLDHKVNLVDIEVLDDNSFVLSNGIVSHNSAAKTILSARDPKLTGVYPLKGKPLNVRDIKISRLTSNQEFANIMSIIGLKLGHDIEPKDLRFGKIIIAADYDCIDGNSLVLTEDGDKKIKDVTIFDKVLTHSNEYKNVVDVIKSDKQKIVKVTINGETRKFSEHHKLIIMRDGDIIEEYAKNVKSTDCLLIK